MELEICKDCVFFEEDTRFFSSPICRKYHKIMLCRLIEVCPFVDYEICVDVADDGQTVLNFHL